MMQQNNKNNLTESSKFQNKYRIESTRLKDYDYSSNGAYFITICTNNREHFFGVIIDDEIQLSEMGKMVKTEWLKSFKIRTELICDEYCIMPNHIHGIVIINTDCANNTKINVPPSIVKTHGRASLRRPKSVSSFVAGFKSSATKIINEMRNMQGMPVWQPRFHDHIIRNENELNRIREYIKNNSINWKNDKNNIENNL